MGCEAALERRCQGQFQGQGQDQGQGQACCAVAWPALGRRPHRRAGFGALRSASAALVLFPVLLAARFLSGQGAAGVSAAAGGRESLLSGSGLLLVPVPGATPSLSTSAPSVGSSGWSWAEGRLRPRPRPRSGAASAVPLRAVATQRGRAGAGAGAGGAKRGSRPGPGARYRGAVNPGLRSLLGSDEYRRLIGLLSRLDEQGCLEGFLERADRFWMDINIFSLAMEERQGGGRAVLNVVRREWARIWPGELEAERMGAFELFTDFWKRLDRSRLVDKVVQEVLPDSQKDYDDLMASSDQKKLAAMTDEERRGEIMRRLGESELIKQYAILSQSDPEVQTIAPKMAPFVAKVIASLERKLATQTQALGQTIDYGLIAIGIAVVAGLLLATGIVKLP